MNSSFFQLKNVLQKVDNDEFVLMDRMFDESLIKRETERHPQIQIESKVKKNICFSISVCKKRRRDIQSRSNNNCLSFIHYEQGLSHGGAEPLEDIKEFILVQICD